MAYIQIEGARKILEFIAPSLPRKFSDDKGNDYLTYGKVAERMGRPRSHGKSIGAMCDLLDAAACLAGIPLLALVAVRNDSGKVNPKAWKREYGERRDTIINYSRQYKFREADLHALSRALTNLDGKGNRAAWKHLFEMFPEDNLFKRLIGISREQPESAICDLGSDLADRAMSTSWVYVRNPKVREAVINRACGRCENCGSLGFLKRDGTRYLEAHHIIALASDGEDRLTNVIALCPNDHREAHFGEKAEELEQEMIEKVRMLNGQDA